MIKGFFNFLINKFKFSSEPENKPDVTSPNDSENKSEYYNPHRVNEMTGINVHLALDEPKIGGQSVISGKTPYSYGSADFK